ncbi:MAG: UDP-N-acetylmuramoyl-L-alanine--D-glutamate ligase [Candidatus Babeliales bacterium]
MNLNNKKIGIWGYGIMGKATAAFLAAGHAVTIFDQRALSLDEEATLQKLNVAHEQNLEQFLQTQDIIIPSGGIDLRPFASVHHKLLPELDLFALYFKKPIIAITGTLGKTTVTTLLTKALAHAGKRVVCGGNIGVGLCDLLEKQDELDYAVLEVSSFQLEHCTLFAPDLAILTNFFPNHLDRHTTLQDYFAAKKNMFAYQKEDQKSLVPLTFKNDTVWPKATRFFSCKKQNSFENNLYYLDNKKIIDGVTQKELCDIAALPPHLYQENILIVAAALNLLGIAPDISFLAQEQTIEHRLEKVATKNNITFYNDSKSTVPQATLTALNALGNSSVILFLGGISKGIDRKPMIKELQGKVKKVYCFGKEAEQLFTACAEYTIPAEAYSTLEQAFSVCMDNAQGGDAVLFSPAGASFDLFKNYQERGAYFKKLVHSF